MSEPLKSLPSGRVTSKDVLKELFAADHPEQFIRTIPAQTLYAALKNSGLESSSEVIELATNEQCRTMLDFDCWEKWSFREESIWEWLSITDDSDGLKILQKIARTIDLKLVALLIARYVDFVTFDEPTENPPGKGFYTPDKGFTWLTITLEDSHKHFLLGRLLAMIFESDAELFYRLLAISQQLTQSELEEEAYIEKSKRLQSEGIPEMDTAAASHAPISIAEITHELTSRSRHVAITDLMAVHPLIYDTVNLQPLTSLLAEITSREDAEIELTYIINSGIVKWGIQFHETEQVRQLAEKIKGAINIGLTECQKLSSLPVVEIFEILGLQKIYRVGLAKLIELAKQARTVRSTLATDEIDDQELIAVLDRADEPFPAMPLFLKKHFERQEIHDFRLETGAAPIEKLEELEFLSDFLRERIVRT